jgi:trigger factor
MDFEGEVGGKAFDGGKGEDMSVEIGSGRLISGFEDQLVGAKSGDLREIKVTFPEDYPVENLKGKDATFAVAVKQVKTAGETKIDDEFAKSLGLSDLDQLKGLIRGQVEQELNGLTRTHMKRQLLDQLADRHDFQVPESMVDAEYQNILAQLRHEASHEEDPKAALAEIEADADEYRNIAVRRVRLGLLLSEIGAENGVEITEQEMNRLVMQAASQYQGKDRENFVRYIQQEPMAAAQLRAPLYEDKVVDFLFGRAEISDRKATRAELEADLESEEGHVHGPGCGHDHEHDHAAKPKAKKPAASKAKAKAADKAPEETTEKAPEKTGKKGADKTVAKGADKGQAKLSAEKPAKASVDKEAAKAKPVKAAKTEPAAKVSEKAKSKPVSKTSALKKK